jgi:hypothetical protein
MVPSFMTAQMGDHRHARLDRLLADARLDRLLGVHSSRFAENIFTHSSSTRCEASFLLGFSKGAR